MTNKRVVVGISSSVLVDQGGMFPGYKRAYVNKDYVDSVILAGGVPMIIPFSEDKEVIKSQMELVDALILSGGHDVYPYNYGKEPSQKIGEVFPERDEYDFALLEIAKEKKIPILGICRGHQIINVYEGGTLLQDLSEAKTTLLKHSQGSNPAQKTQKIKLEKSSKLYDIFAKDELFINSFHHQVIDEVASGYKVTARTSDGVVEAIECENYPFLVGVQWHPEMMAKTCDDMLKLFKRLVAEAKK